MEEDIVKEFHQEIRTNHSSAGGKSVFTFPAHRWDVKGREQFEAKRKRIVARKIGDNYWNIGSKSADRNLMIEDDWEKIDMIYVENKRASNVQIAIYNKKSPSKTTKSQIFHQAYSDTLCVAFYFYLLNWGKNKITRGVF